MKLGVLRIEKKRLRQALRNAKLKFMREASTRDMILSNRAILYFTHYKVIFI